MELRKLIREYPNALSKEECEEIISRFESSDKLVRGRTGNDSMTGGVGSYKKSTDLYITNQKDWEDIDTLFFNSIQKPTMNYFEWMHENIGFFANKITESGYQIQRTDVGDGYPWHHDAKITLSSFKNIDEITVEYSTRCFTYIMYLNDNFGGGHTEFFGKEDVYVKPETGKLIFFPANDLFIHQGAPVTAGSKYIMTGWMYYNQYTTME